MKNFGVVFTRSLVVLLSVSFIVSSASAGTTKENKKKLLDKLRAALNSSEVESPVATLPTMEDLEKAGASEDGEKVVVEVEEGHDVVQDEIGGEATDIKTEESSTEVVANTFSVRFRNVVKRVLEVLGLRRRKDGRQTRMLTFEGNELDRGIPVYQDEVRTTVGAVLGQKECIQKVACVSGTYLKEIKGKQLIFAFLDVFSPISWKETVRIAKQSAIHNELCDYKCLEG